MTQFRGTGVAKTRIDDQIDWYDKKSGYCQRMFKVLKLLTITVAALIPLFAGLDAPAWATGTLGALIVVLEGAQQLNQYHANWIAFRSTAEALKHEKHLHLALAGPYADVASADLLLAERVEGLVSQEHAKWVSAQQEAGKVKPSRLS
jgi:uncharacterized protein DUF4231